VDTANRPGIPGVLDPALRDRPHATAVVARSGSRSYAELDAAAARAAAALCALGVLPGDRVAAGLPNDLDVVVAFHGVMRLGALWVGVGEALAPPEKARLLGDCEPTVLLAPAEVLGQVPGPWTGVDPGRWRDLLARAGTPPVVDVDVHAPAGIAYTSGTTGDPKGIVHSQHNLLLPGAVLVASRGWGPGLRKGDCLPLTILNLMVLTTLLTAQAQGCCVVMDRRDPEGVAGWLREERVTHWNGVPAQLHDLARGPWAEDRVLASLEELWSGGGDCPDSLRAAVEAAHGLSLRGTYGLTEAPTVVSIDPVGSERRAGASGRVLDHLDVRAHDEQGRPLPPGVVGELWVSARHDGPWAGQWTPPLGVWRSGRVVPHGQGEVRTGDLGTVDADGWLTVLDRRKLVVVRGGANVYPAEVERLLLDRPGVAGAAVFGVPDARLGERVAVVVQLEPGADVALDDLRDHCAAQLARYKVPEHWAQVDALPRNAMGKVVRTALPALADQLWPGREEHAGAGGARA
jgi:long-chain acyl-CoA synthetase